MITVVEIESRSMNEQDGMTKDSNLRSITWLFSSLFVDSTDI